MTIFIEYFHQLQIHNLPTTNLLVEIIPLVVIGAIAYTLVLLLVWFLFGRPQSAETIVIVYLCKKLSY